MTPIVEINRSNPFPGLHPKRTSRKPTPAERVHGLLRFPFSPVIREHTIKELLQDPITSAIVQAALK